MSLPVVFSNALFKESFDLEAASEPLIALYEQLGREEGRESCREILIASLSEGQAWNGTHVLRRHLLKQAARMDWADLLSRSGNAAQAAKILGLEVTRVASKRDDLQQELVMAHAEQLLEQGDARKALEVIERVLEEQKDGGVKLLPLLVEYKKLAKKAGLSKQADRFLSAYGR